ncbi:MAG: hypothetical protein ABW208_08325 [Pyrinomonadaceae bacterium]
MKRKLFVTLLTSAVLLGAHAQAGGTQNDMPQQDAKTQQQEQHVVASPNPTIDDSKSTAIDPGKVTSAPVQPDATATAAPMKPTAKPKPKRKRTGKQ